MAFVPYEGQFRPLRLMFGVTNGPQYFHKVINQVFGGIENLTSFFDDLQGGTATFDELWSCWADC
jgi:hypothetical protein